MGFMEGYQMTAGNRQFKLDQQRFAQQSAMEQQRANLAMAQFSEERQARVDKETNAAKSAEYFFKANPEGLAALGETPETFKNKSAGDRYSAMVAYGQAMMAREQQAKMQAEARSAQGLANFNRSYRNVTTPMNVPAGTFGALSPQETIGGGPLDAREVFNLATRSGMNPMDSAKLMKEFGDADKANSNVSLPAGARVTGGTVGPNGPSLTFTTQAQRNGEQPQEIFLKDGSSARKAMYSDGTIIDLPTDKTKALTEAQANALQYSDRMSFNNKVMTDLEQVGFKPTGAGAAVQKWTPNVMTGENFQKYDAARKNWISAVLRKESGAAISKSEEKGALEQYFPAFGDAPGVVQQKSELRALAEQNMRRAIGEITPHTPAATSQAKQFDSEADARAAGVGTNVFMLYDPSTATYRKARFK